jgi:hypothetical protein
MRPLSQQPIPKRRKRSRARLRADRHRLPPHWKEYIRRYVIVGAGKAKDLRTAIATDDLSEGESCPERGWSLRGFSPAGSVCGNGRSMSRISRLDEDPADARSIRRGHQQSSQTRWGDGAIAGMRSQFCDKDCHARIESSISESLRASTESV